MFKDLPLTALRSFEATARLGSVKAAAQELFVTPTAVSHQLRSLEGWLGTTVFERHPRALRLTDAGSTLFESVHEALQGLARSVDQLRPQPSAGQIMVSMTPAFASLWLIPRLSRFYAQHPDVTVRLDTRCEAVDLLRDASIDAVIRYGQAASPGLCAQRVADETYAVYAAPSVVASTAGVPATLISIDCLEAEPGSGWKAWCDAAGVDWLRSARVICYPEESLALQAAVAGQGHVLASSVLVSSLVESGLLVACGPATRIAGSGYSALAVPGRERHPPVRAFLSWVVAEAREAGPGG